MCVYTDRVTMAVHCIPLRSDGKTDLTTDAAAVRRLAAIVAVALAVGGGGGGGLLLSSCRYNITYYIIDNNLTRELQLLYKCIRVWRQLCAVYTEYIPSEGMIPQTTADDRPRAHFYFGGGLEGRLFEQMT